MYKKEVRIRRGGDYLKKKALFVIGAAAILTLSACSDETPKPIEQKQEQMGQKELTTKENFKKVVGHLKTSKQVSYSLYITVTSKGNTMNGSEETFWEPQSGNSKVRLNASNKNVEMYEVGGKIFGYDKNPSTGKVEKKQIEERQTYGLDTGSALLTKFERAADYASEMKTEKQGEDVLLTLDLQGEKAMEAFKTMNPSLPKWMEKAEENVKTLRMTFLLSKDYKLKSFTEEKEIVKLNSARDETASRKESRKVEVSYDTKENIKL